MARVEITECHENHITKFYSDGTIEEIPYQYEDGLQVVSLDPNNEIWSDN